MLLKQGQTNIKVSFCVLKIFAWLLNKTLHALFKGKVSNISTHYNNYIVNPLATESNVREMYLASVSYIMSSSIFFSSRHFFQ